MDKVQNSETQRLQTLHSMAILDTEPNPAIDGIVKAAAGLCDAPMALVTLLDEKRQWFKARFGLNDVTETLRSVAFCDHTIQGTNVMVVDDALDDERFRDNPLVTGKMALRFYAGAPLIADGGARIGALCVLDQKPNSMASIQKEALARLAETVVELLQQESDTRLEFAEVSASVPSDDTVETIVAGARAVLTVEGPADFSVRKVAKAADVSLSTVQHHFPSKAALIAAVVDALRTTFFSFYTEQLQPIPNPVDRFVACATHILDQGPDKNMIKLLRDLWSLASRDEQIAMTLSEFYADCRKLAADVLKDANPDLSAHEAKMRACNAVSLLSGAFLYTDPWFPEASVDGFRDHVLATITRLPFRTY